IVLKDFDARRVESVSLCGDRKRTRRRALVLRDAGGQRDDGGADAADGNGNSNGSLDPAHRHNCTRLRSQRKTSARASAGAGRQRSFYFLPAPASSVSSALRLRRILPVGSMLITLTRICSPSLSSSRTSLTRWLAISETCRRPSVPGMISTNA